MSRCRTWTASKWPRRSRVTASRRIPIIFLSAINTHKKFVARGYTSGGIDYVTKPVDPDILLLKICLHYSKINTNEEFEVIDLNAMIQEIMSDLEVQIELKHCTFNPWRL